MKNKSKQLFAVLALVFCAARAGGAAAAPVATLDDVKGRVAVRGSGMIIWRPAENGLELEAGDTVKTHGMSGVVVRFTAGGFMKIRALSEVTVDAVEEESGLKSNVVSIGRGGVWAQAESGGDAERLIVETAGGVLDTRGGTFFLEADESGRAACVDVFGGEAAFRTFLNPDEVKNLQKENRLVFEAGQPVEDPGAISSSFNSNDENYSCLPKLEQPASGIETGAEGEQLLVLTARATVMFSYESEPAQTRVESDTGEEMLIVVTAAANVVFEEKAPDSGVTILSSSGTVAEELSEIQEIVVTRTATVSFSPPEEKEPRAAGAGGDVMYTPEGCRGMGQQCIIPEDCCSGNCEENLCTSGEGIEHETIVVTTSASVSFICADLPKIDGVSVNGRSVSAGAAVDLAGGECDETIKATVTWKVTPLCGAVVSHVFSAAGASADQEGVPDDQTREFTSVVELSTEEAVEMKISASDNFNNSSSFSFKAQFKKHENVSRPPVIASVSYAGNGVSAGQAVEAVVNDCEEGAFAISGIAVSVCGGISSVSVTQDSEELPVTGQAEWAAAHKVHAESGRSNFTIVAESSTGRKSQPFNFSVSYKVNPSLLVPPSITSALVNDKEVSPGETVEALIEDCAGEQLKISGAAAAVCSSITSVSVLLDGKPLSAAGQAEWSAEYTASSSRESSVSISATDANGRKSDPFTFTISQRLSDELTSPPAIQSVSYGGKDVSSGDTVEFPFEDCRPATLALSGSATTACGNLKTLSVTKNGVKVPVSGLSEWSVTDTLYPSGEPAVFRITAADSAGAQSDPFEFTVQPETENIPLPEAALGAVSGITVEDPPEPVTLYRNNLQSGKLSVSGSSRAESGACPASSVEVSLDDGGSWQKAAGTNPWSFDFRPSDGTYEISTRTVDSLGRESEPSRPLELTYKAVSPETEVFDVFDRLLRAYIDKDSSTFIDLTSPSYTSNYEGIHDSQELETSLSNKFLALNTIYLVYTVKSTVVSQDIARVTFSWNSTPSAAGFPNTGVFSFAKDESSKEWLFSGVDDDNTFLRYTSVAAKTTLSASKYSLTADTDETAVLSAEVRDSANNLIRDGTEVVFTTTFNSSTDTETAATIDGTARKTFDAGGACGAASVYAVSSGIRSNTININVDQTAAAVVLSASDYQLMTGLAESTTVYAEVRDSAGNLICDGKRVDFFTDSGSIAGMNTTLDGTTQAAFDAAGVCEETCASKMVSIYAVSGTARSNTIQIEVRHETAPFPPGE